MCGIVGAVAQRDIVPVLIEGLRRLEYRGYDSCGVAVYADGELKRVRSVGRVAELTALTRAYDRHAAGGYFVAVVGEAGIGKTRLAEEFLAEAQARGAMTVTVRCYEGEGG
ncbi:MAG: AAA family ATPase, partial [Burkholderiaceae bacterium]|nr:AAA family ATPase [Burkholderiaceae bacterium]